MIKFVPQKRTVMALRHGDILNLIEPALSLRWWLSWISIFLGCLTMAAGFVYFINPYNIVPGGVYGAGIVLHNIFPAIKVGTFGYMFDGFLLCLAFYLFGSRFGTRTVIAAMTTPGLMNILTIVSYPDEQSIESLDPTKLLGGILDMSDHLMLTAIMGAVLIGIGVGVVVRNHATTGGTDIVAMILQKYCHVNFAKGELMADSVVVLSGLAVVGFGLGVDTVSKDGWLLSMYSLISIYVSSRVVAYILEGGSYDKLIFVISENHNEELKDVILHRLDRSATYIKAKGMYTGNDKEMIFLVVSRKEVVSVQRFIKDSDPNAFVVVTDAFNTYGEGFKPMPSDEDLQNM